MKRLAVLFLLLVMFLTLCACNTVSSGNAHSEETAKYLGTWASTRASIEDYYVIYNITFLENGKALLDYYVSDPEFSSDDDLGAGEWILEDDRIIVFHYEDGDSCAAVYHINTDGTLTYNKKTYRKVEQD